MQPYMPDVLSSVYESAGIQNDVELVSWKQIKTY